MEILSLAKDAYGFAVPIAENASLGLQLLSYSLLPLCMRLRMRLYLR
jgi:hypothetical protein